MARRLVVTAVLFAAICGPQAAAASCFDLAGSSESVSATRAQVANQCPCSSAVRRSDYMRCVRGVVNTAVDNGDLPRSCRGQVLKCARKSTCGYPAGYVPCCKTSASGTTRCSIKRSAADCTASSGTCTGYFSSCCESCTSGGCVIPTPTLTPTITSTPTITPTPTFPPFCQSIANLPSQGRVPFTIDAGTADCGGPMLNPAPQPPVSGVVEDDGVEIGELGLGCLYTGSLPGVKIPDGATSYLEAVGVGIGTITLGPSVGTGPANCTKAAGPGRHCANGKPGTDGMGACTGDLDCPGVFPVGACVRDANCFFGPPIPVPEAAVPVCIVGVFESDMCGAIDLTAGGETTLTTFLTSRIYQSDGDFAHPCPRCLAGTCNSGANLGEACVTTSSTETSADCLPNPAKFFATLPVVLPEVTTGTSELEAADSVMCPGSFGAFGLLATRVAETGSPLGATPGDLQRMSIGGTFCVSPSGNGSLDFAAGLPGVGALSATGTMDLGSVIGLPPLP